MNFFKLQVFNSKNIDDSNQFRLFFKFIFTITNNETLKLQILVLNACHNIMVLK